MTDRRLTPATARVAHNSLQGRTDLPLTAGEEMEIAAPLADVLTAPNGARDRQLVYGEAFCAIDTAQTHAFGFARKDGYCGWVALADLRAAQPKTHPKTHWVCAIASHLYPAAKVQALPLHTLPFGANIAVLEMQGNFARTEHGYIPLPHIRALGSGFADPVDVAAMFLGAPYLWGGNSAAGIDCSGLVQGAHLACGIPALADSDLQQAMGVDAAGSPYARGDLLFWRGHVALVVDGARLIHANGHTMSVVYEGIADCIARIAAAGGGDVTAHRRISRRINR